MLPQARSDNAPRRVLFQTLVGDIRLVLHGLGTPSDEEVERHIEDAVAIAGSVRAVLVIADTPDAGGPNAPQRAQMARAGLLRLPTAVVTDSEATLHVVTAMSWLGGPIRVFRPNQLEHAFDFLQISDPLRSQIATQVAGLKYELRRSSRPPPRSTMRPRIRQRDR